MKKVIITLSTILAVSVLWFLFRNYFSLEQAQHIAKKSFDYSQKNVPAVFAILAGAHCITMICSLPTKAVLTLLAGALLGTAGGTVCTLVGVLPGTTVLFFTARYFFRDWVLNKLGPRLKRVEERMSERPIRAIIGLRLFITIPYGPVTLAAALSSTRYRDFFIGTIIGDLPVVVAYCVAGKQLFDLTGVSEAVSPWTAVTFAGAGLFILVTAFLGKKTQ